MKRFLLNLSAFLLVTVIVYPVLVVLSGTVAPTAFKNLSFRQGGSGNLFTRLQDADTTENVDILFLGSSHAYRGYDTRIFKKIGYSSFNLGSSAQTPFQTEILVNRYLGQMNPRLVVIDIHPALFGSDGIESMIDLISNSKIDLQLALMAAKTYNIKVYNTLLLSFYKQLFKGWHNYKEPLTEKGSTYVSGGFVETFKKYEPSRKASSTRYRIDKEQLDAFKRIVASLHGKGIPFVLVRNLITKRSYQSVVNNEETNAVFSEYGNFYDFNKILSLSNENFFDDSHLNQYGVNRFNARLIDTLVSLELIDSKVSISDQTKNLTTTVIQQK